MYDHFEKISLSDIGNIAFADRQETKFVIKSSILPKIFEQIHHDYFILEINKLLTSKYRSSYLDTASFRFFFEHQRGIPRRNKVRFRSYLDTDLHFFEVKKKDGRGRTQKSRIEIAKENIDLNQNTLKFLSNHIKNVRALDQVLDSTYERITLVNKNSAERITVDQKLTFKSDMKSISFDDLAIIEVKQAQLDRSSPIFNLLRKENIRPSGFSKYCTGIACLYPQVKSNTLKPHFRKIRKITA